ncbi:MAG: enoyl-CoA hydratase-related protein [Bacteroidetes bacterium]|nr:enoyl-CoA hydratase-related protein [Bacteroidota bacterium]
MNYQNLLFSVNEKVAIVTINRPDKLNALNSQTMEELKNIFIELNNNNDVSVIILTGSGEKAFVAGADISELNKLDMLSAKKFSESGQEVFNLIENLEKPVIAAVNGFALGGGCELALACHFRIASENAQFGQPEINLGIIPGYGGTQRLSRQINSGRAMEYILTGNMIDANEALRIGLVNHVYPQKDLIANAVELAVKISLKSRITIRHAIQAINASKEMSLKEGLDYEASIFALCCGSADFKEGTSAFLEKRKPNFKNL